MKKLGDDYKDLALWTLAMTMAQSIGKSLKGREDAQASELLLSSAKIPASLAIGYANPEADIADHLQDAFERTVILEHQLMLAGLSAASEKSVATAIGALKEALLTLIEGDDLFDEDDE